LSRNESSHLVKKRRKWGGGKKNRREAVLILNRGGEKGTWQVGAEGHRAVFTQGIKGAIVN